jgi:alkylated DNA repair dioxygenase AlkB
MPAFHWKECALIEKIKEELENKLGTYFDYCLAHCYPDGEASIGWHNDKEALETDVVSISFGATRKFRFRKLGETKGYCKEFNLGNGDVLHMLSGCQKIYKHSVPVEKTVKTPRINLTFRKY